MKEKFDNLSFESKYSNLITFYYDLKKYSKVKPTKKKKDKKEKVHDRITQLWNKRSEIYSDENEKLSDAKKH